jgi:pantoate--beta-alanine ligase
MQLIQTAALMQAFADEHRRAGRRLALVPTMGALHDGHLALVQEARRLCDQVVVSIFVNPTQFGPNEDYQAYPRTLEHDLHMLEAAGGVDGVFAPPEGEVYPFGVDHVRCWVQIEQLDEHLCGRFRPGHFRGVTTVVSKLFTLCKPHVAVFGLKDAQQFLILKRMVRELHFDVELVGGTTVREEDGLAMSSRNLYLSPDERAQAVVLSRAASAARRHVEGGEADAVAIKRAMQAVLAEAPGARVQYAEVVDTEYIQPVERINPGQEVLSAVAVFFGKTRLIDNAFARAPL